MTLTTYEELKHLASSDNTNELTRRLARECMANREAQPVYQYRMRNPYNDQVTDWETIKPEQVDFILKETIAANVEFRIIAAPPAPAVPEEMKRDPDADVFDPGFMNGWNACRAAMLAQPVSSGYTLPDGWIACSEQMPEVGERDWRTALPVLVKCEIGVIPAYYGFTYHEGEQCFGFMESIKFGDGSGSGPEQYENRLMMHVTHWMPLPAAPEGGNG
ncbi:DUF551 domain-containing protein [Serratia ureilytica]|uniref:DUF551 domain-containing protein n=1 Tax=Serratia ureilytica TaxID=300181 RepID=UPI0034C60C01